MYIKDTLYTFENHSYEFYIQGCLGRKKINGKLQHCPGCHNPELHKFKKEDNIVEVLENFDKSFHIFNNMIDEIWILGGEPLDQNKNELLNFIKKLKKYNKDIYLFTGYELDFVKKEWKEIFDYIDYIKVGYYDENLKNKEIKSCNMTLYSSNQNIYDIKNNKYLT